MKWYYLDEKNPPHSGKYLVAARVEGGVHLRNHIFLNEYDYANKAFSFDQMMKERAEPYRIYAWAEISPPPLHKASIQAKQEKQQ